jgi:hypothetical protein
MKTTTIATFVLLTTIPVASAATLTPDDEPKEPICALLLMSDEPFNLVFIYPSRGYGDGLGVVQWMPTAEQNPGNPTDGGAWYFSGVCEMIDDVDEIITYVKCKLSDVLCRLSVPLGYTLTVASEQGINQY